MRLVAENGPEAAGAILRELADELEALRALIARVMGGCRDLARFLDGTTSVIEEHRRVTNRRVASHGDEPLQWASGSRGAVAVEKARSTA